MNNMFLVAVSVFSINAFAQNACENFSGSYIASETISGGGQFKKGKRLYIKQEGCDILSIEQPNLIKREPVSLYTLACDGNEDELKSSDGSDTGIMQLCVIKRDQITISLRNKNSSGYVESTLIKLGNGKIFYRSIGVDGSGETTAEQVNLFEKH